MSRWTPPRRRHAVVRDAARWFARNRSETPDPTAFERWRTADPAHAAAYARLESHFQAAGAVGRQPPPPRRLAIPLAVAAAVALLAVAVPALLDDAAVRTDIAEQRTLALDDGSRVLLDTATVLEPAFDEGARRLYLREGRARFIVAHGDARPFIVEAGGLEVVATGTRFDVRAEAGRVEVVLIEGRVEVRGPRARRALAAGEMVASSGGSLAVSPADLEVARAWPAGRLVFDGVTLARVVAEANRYATQPIILADPELGHRRVTGSFAAADTAAIARMLAASLHLELSRRGDRHVLAAPPPPASAPD